MNLVFSLQQQARAIATGVVLWLIVVLLIRLAGKISSRQATLQSVVVFYLPRLSLHVTLTECTYHQTN